MSSVGDAFTALKNVMLMQERIEGLKRDMAISNGDLRTLTEKVFELDKRVVRIETMIEMTAGRGPQPPRIEGS
jgi:hypothetical protein